jgi:ATP-dependent Clp protease protease subunit
MTNDFEKYAKSKGVSGTSLHKYKSFLNSYTPYIAEKSDQNIAIMDVFSRLMYDRIVFLGTDIDEYVGNIISAQILYLNSDASLEDGSDKTDIKLYINSGGGEIYTGNSILDIMDTSKYDIATLCTGLAASMSAVILSNGTPGKRNALKRSRVMIHQPLGGTHGQSSDIEIYAKEIKNLKKELAQTLADNSNKDLETIMVDIDRDNWLTSKEAKDYGLIDNIVTKK